MCDKDQIDTILKMLIANGIQTKYKYPKCILDRFVSKPTQTKCANWHKLNVSD